MKFLANLKAHLFWAILYDIFMIDYKVQFPIMTKKLIMLLNLVVLHSMFINGKTTCKWLFVEEWHTQSSSSYVVNCPLTKNICMDLYGDCTSFGDVNTKMNTSGNQVVPQICPLQIQLGDILIISSEPSLQSPEIYLMNVSEASFIDCRIPQLKINYFLVANGKKCTLLILSGWVLGPIVLSQ